MDEPIDLPDETERLQINLEDDIRSFLVGRLAWNRMLPKKQQQLRGMGIDITRMRRPTFISVARCFDTAADEDTPNECRIGAEGVMAHEDEEVIHLAFKCGNPDHKMHYTAFDVGTVIAMARACEAAFPGSISTGLLQDAIRSGSVEVASPSVLESDDDEADAVEIELDDNMVEGLEDAYGDDDDEDDLFI